MLENALCFETMMESQSAVYVADLLRQFPKVM
jgi:hypothetical protein